MLIDFLIGLFGANALPHFVMGKLDARVLGLFGCSGRANVAYAWFCSLISLGLFQWKYGLANVADHMMFVGICCVVLSYYFGWPVIMRFLRKPANDRSDCD